jgi:hypothetical protein
MTHSLEKRFRVLVGLYPPGWRNVHGEELLSTLLDAAPPGQRWPSPRETMGLIVGASREQMRSRGVSTPSEVVGDGPHIGATLIVAANGCIAVFAMSGGGERVAGVPSEWSTVELLWVLAFAALVAGGRFLAPALVLLVACLSGASVLAELSHVPFPSTDGWSQVLAATLIGRILVPAVIIVWLAARGEHPARSPLWLLAVAPAAATLTQASDIPLSIGTSVVVLMVPVVVASLVWAAVDPRPAIGVTTFLASTWLILAATASDGNGLPIPISWALTTLAATVLACAALVGSAAVARSRRL